MRKREEERGNRRKPAITGAERKGRTEKVRERETNREREREGYKNRGRQREREKERERKGERKREREREREKEKERKRERETDRERERSQVIQNRFTPLCAHGGLGRGGMCLCRAHTQEGHTIYIPYMHINLVPLDVG